MIKRTQNAGVNAREFGRKKNPRRPVAGKGQVILEFTFCMIVIMIMIYGIAKVFFWTGADLATRRMSHDKRLTWLPFLTNTVIDKYSYLGLVYLPNPLGSEWIVLEQIEPNYHTPIHMNAIWEGLN